MGVRIDVTSYDVTTARVLDWAAHRRSCYICFENVHVVMQAHDLSSYARVVNGAALVTPDGMPLVWFARCVGIAQSRVYGPDLMLHVCKAAATQRIAVGLLGGTPDTVDTLVERLHARFPELVIAYRHAPPFRALTADEDAKLVADCIASGVQILFVGLGCPKQEIWMAEHLERIPAVMLGVGAAFDFHAGKIPQAPAWMQAHGLEWLYRLSREPRRLARRYMRHNPRFVARALPALWRQRRASARSGR